MNGTVTLSLEDYHALRDASPNLQSLKRDILQSTKELEVFLTFLITRENIDEHLEEFNSYSKTCKVHIVDGRAKIQLIKLKEDDEEV
jgi:hypothetical protein